MKWVIGLIVAFLVIWALSDYQSNKGTAPIKPRTPTTGIQIEPPKPVYVDQGNFCELWANGHIECPTG